MTTETDGGTEQAQARSRHAREPSHTRDNSRATPAPHNGRTRRGKHNDRTLCGISQSSITHCVMDVNRVIGRLSEVVGTPSDLGDDTPEEMATAKP